MRIAEFELTAFRGARSLKLACHEKLNVFFGINGAGKSTILDALALSLSWLVNSMTQQKLGTGRPITEDSITNGLHTASVKLTIESQGQFFDWTRTKSRKGHATLMRRGALQRLKDFSIAFQKEFISQNEAINLPLFVYYPINRAVLDIPLRIRERHSFDIFAAYEGSLTSGANFRTFFEWFREREDLENENRRFSSEDPASGQFPDPQLQAVRDALHAFLPEFSNLAVRRNPLRMEVEKNGQRLTVNQLSDGEKCIIAMLGDLARRLAIANPLRSNPLEGEGVVLIDEIDLHLHPRWQRILIPNLQTVFPNCQFFITTHSPHVVTHVRPESLYGLRQGENGIDVERPSESYGKNAERILEDLMGLDTTRPNPVEAAIQEIFATIEKGSLKSAKTMLEKLEKEIGADPELVKASVLIKRKELIGK